jgi:hypothetical protein
MLIKIGGERAMLLLPSSGGRFTDEVTDIFTTACRCFRIGKRCDVAGTAVA